MSKVLVVLEHHFVKDSSGNVWCKRIIDYSYLERYLQSFDDVYVFGRMSYSQDVDGYKLVSGPHVNFIEIPDFAGAIGTLKNKRKIWKICKKDLDSFDVVIARAPTVLSLSIYNKILKKGKTLGIEMMCSGKKLFSGDSLFYKLLNLYTHFLVKKMCRKANGISYVTRYILQENYPPHLPDKFHFNTYYSSVKLTDQDYFIRTIKPQTKYTISLFAYMDDNRKGHYILMDMLNELLKKGYNVELVFVGDGDYRKKFMEYASSKNLMEHIEFVGVINDINEKRKILRKTDFVVLPTYAEGLPRTLLEAFAHSIPCVSSPVDGIVEIIDSEFLFKFDDAIGFANCVIRLIENIELRKALSIKNYNISLEYKEDILNHKRKEFYDKLKEISQIKH